MNQEQWEDDRLLPLLSIAATLVRRWRAVIRWAIGGLGIAVVWGLGTVATFTSTASFTPEGADPSRASTLANLAGQFGVQLPSSGGQSLSPEFYVRLLRSPVVLRAIARDSITVPELDGRRVAFVDLFEVRGESPGYREEKALRLLGELARASSEKLTGVVTVTITTKWASVSHALVQALVTAVNDYNLKTRQGQATAERRFVETRVTAAEADLRRAENELEALQVSNRQISASPELQMQRDRLQRTVTMKQLVYTSLAQSYEQARLREVRDTPVITILEPPSYPAVPNSRGRLVALVTGLVLGAFVGILVVYGGAVAERRRHAGDLDLAEFVGAVQEAKAGAMSAARRILRRRSRA